MSITKESELVGMQKASEAVACTLKEMRNYARPGMSTEELDEFGAGILEGFGAKSAPYLTYGFPGWTCISVNNEFCHGIPSGSRILREGDLVNIDVSAELGGYWSDNGASFVLGEDLQGHQALVDASKDILRKAIAQIRGGVRIADIGHLIETEARKRGYKVIKNLTGHGVGRSLHEEPAEIANFRDRFNTGRFKKNSVVAIETFIATTSTYAETLGDGWTMVGNKGGFMAQHEHTIVVTDGQPLILTAINGIWNGPVPQDKHKNIIDRMNTSDIHNERIAKMTFASVYPHYVAKVEKKGRTKEELHQVISWLTGFNEERLRALIAEKATFETFFREATLHPNASQITGTICGYRIEDIENPLTRQVRYLDKLVDELAKGRKMEKILRGA
ncbi:type I methionyl aminopeptidase [Flaviaesturariibacter flavus]|uniref:type I methionyl aminopeptidase n=1 Tax=Flaviaesturariibacter flavus TaxID=2502780 RepID=UPI001FB2993D|nr:type I methionyl aminopeptidase [Flaviaesturariibacter flavus]